MTGFVRRWNYPDLALHYLKHLFFAAFCDRPAEQVLQNRIYVRTFLPDMEGL